MTRPAPAPGRTLAARRRRPEIARAIDVFLALLVLAVGIPEVLSTENLRGPVALNLLVVAGMAAALLLRRTHVVAAGVLCGALTAASGLWLGHANQASAPWPTALLLAYAAGRYGTTRESWIALAALLAGLETMWAGTPDIIPSDLFFPALFVVISFGAGHGIRRQVELGAELHEAAARADEQADRAADAARAEERRRVAREMHDIIAHSVSVMVVQAGGARRILGKSPERAAEAATLIEQTGREALAELRTLLGALDPDDTAADASAVGPPAPTLASIPQLAERARESGLQVELRGDLAADPADPADPAARADPAAPVEASDARPLPAGLDQAAYRIVQEALTNALRHAGPVRATVDVHRDGDAIVITVENDPGHPGPGRGPAAALSRPGGHGLVGMAERAALYGGELDAGPTPSGGYRVHTRLTPHHLEVSA